MNASVPACDDGRIRYGDQEVIIRNCHLAARADLRASPGRHPGLGPAGTAAVSPSRWAGSGSLALPGQGR